jgi:hypothetical protein
LVITNDAIAVRKRQVLEQNSLNDAVDRRVRADPQGERQNGDRRV